MCPATSLPSLRFGVYSLDLRAGELTKGGSRIRLQEKPLRVLALLTERQGELVTREELKKRLWPEDTFVDFETGLNTAVSKLRDALSDSADKPRYIETIPRRGYRFIVPVERGGGNGDEGAESASAIRRATQPIEIDGDANASSTATARPATSAAAFDERTANSRRREMFAFGLALIAVALAAYFGLHHFRSQPASPAARVMLVVLPFDNLTGDPSQDYVSDGFTEEMITQLGELNHQRMGVIARTSAMNYRNSSKSIKQIAQELGVDYVLEGSIRKAGDGLRITAQLIRADDQTHIWAHEYDRSAGDLSKLQGEVAQDIAREIQIQLTPQEQVALLGQHVPVPEAYRSYLRGRYNLNKRSIEGMRTAIGAFNEAIEEDPNYAPAYSGLADTYNLLIYYGFLPGSEGVPKARAAAKKAVELDDTLAEGHASLGYVDFMWDLNWRDAEKQFQRAIELDDSYAPGHHWYALLLAALGRRDASLAQIRQAQQLDPLSLIVTTAAAYVSYFARDYGTADKLCENALGRDPNFMVAHTVLGLTREQEGEPEAAIAEFQKALELSGTRPAVYLDYLGHAYAVAGKRAEAEAVLSQIDQQVKPGGVSPVYRAATLAALGRKDQALDALEEGSAPGAGGESEWLNVDPRFETLRSDPRFQRLLRMDGFTP
jgi:TolB-like protein/DNA-binding winged helix-turn-helix (wHTH) protein/Tfp pilus assembly protein PilF